MGTSTMLRGALVGLALAACDPDDEDPMDMEDDLEPQPGDPEFERDPALDVEVVSAHGSDRSAGMTGN